MTLEADVGVTIGAFVLDVALKVSNGRTLAVVGPNGSGKTTLLRTLAGLTPLTSGHITLDDEVLDDPAADRFRPPEARSVAIVFQDFVLFPHLSALDNVAFGARARGRNKADARRYAGEWLDRVGLGDRAGAHPRELSGGQAQRVALARALASDPALLLLDEPLAALDATTRIDVRRDLRRHLSTFEGVRVLVTHDPVDAAVLADDVVVLDHGRIAQTGTPDDITARPRTPWVADLVGTNLYRGTANAGTLRVDGGGTIAAATVVDDGPAFAVVHPRVVALHRAKPEGTPRNVWQGHATAIERVGDRIRVQVAGPPNIVAEITSAAATALGLVDGSELWVAVKATEVDMYST
ncbi:MAG: molybdate transport system ATP-binding protein [Acidimicrobiaceae bacterium]|jgi:molybdate transport system ATP-binding protein